MKKFSILLSIVILICLQSVVSYGSDDNYNIFEDVSAPTPTPILVQIPDLKLQDPTALEFKAAGKKNVTFNFKNVSGDAAKSVFFEISLDPSAPFLVTFPDKSNNENIIGGHAYYSLNTTFQIFDDGKDGTYPMTIKYTYYNMSNEKQSYSGTSTVYVKISSMNSQAPLVSVEDFNVSSSPIKPKSDFAITANLHNVNDTKVSNVQVVVEGMTSTTVYGTGQSSTFYAEKMNGNTTVPMTFNFHADENCATGSYELKFKTVYSDSEGKSYENLYSYYVNVDAGSNYSNLKMNLVAPTEIISAEKNFNVVATIKNDGSVPIKNIIVESKPKNDTLIVPMSSNTYSIDVLDVGESKDFTFIYMATKEATSQNYSISVSATYTNKEKDSATSSFAGVNITNPVADTKDEKKDEKEATKSVPKIIIANYSVNPQTVYAGTPFDLSMDFMNTSNSSAVKNVKVSLSVPTDKTETGNVFSPVSGSNTFYIYNIPSGGHVSKTLSLQPDNNATAKNYDLNVTMEYEDAANNPLTQTELVGIKVNQFIKLDYSPLILPEMPMVNMPATVTFDFYNTGKVDLNNLKMKAVGDNIDSSSSEMYFGKFQIGNSDTYDADIIFTSAGEQKGKIMVTYEDENGKLIEQPIDFSLMVEEEHSMANMGDIEMPLGPDGMPLEMKPIEKSKKPFIIGGICSFVIIGGGMTFVILKRRGNKRKDDDLYE